MNYSIDWDGPGERDEDDCVSEFIVWRSIGSAPLNKQILGARHLGGGRFAFYQIFNEWGEWIDVGSDRVVKPHYWIELPEHE